MSKESDLVIKPLLKHLHKFGPFKGAVGLRGVKTPTNLDMDVLAVNPNGPSLAIIEACLGPKTKVAEVGQLLGYWADMVNAPPSAILTAMERAVQSPRNGRRKNLEDWLRRKATEDIPDRSSLEQLIQRVCPKGTPRISLYLAFDQATERISGTIAKLVSLLRARGGPKIEMIQVRNGSDLSFYR